MALVSVFVGTTNIYSFIHLFSENIYFLQIFIFHCNRPLFFSYNTQNKGSMSYFSLCSVVAMWLSSMGCKQKLSNCRKVFSQERNAFASFIALSSFLLNRTSGALIITLNHENNLESKSVQDKPLGWMNLGPGHCDISLQCWTDHVQISSIGERSKLLSSLSHN